MIDIYYLKKSGYKKWLYKWSIDKLGSFWYDMVWIDIVDITVEELSIISKHFNLHHLTEEDIMEPLVRVKVEEFPTYMFCSFYSIRNNSWIDFLQLDFVIWKNFIITQQVEPVEFYEKIKKDQELLNVSLWKWVDFFFYKLLDMVIDNYLPILEGLDEEIVEIEWQLEEGYNIGLLMQIRRLKKCIVKTRRITYPQRDKISFLAKDNYKFISSKHIPYFRDLYDHCVKISDTVDYFKEAILNTFDIYMLSLSNSMNRVMKLLSIITTVLLPLSIISSIYWTNFDFIPLLHNEYGFFIMLTIMFSLSLCILFAFWRKKWI